MRNGNTFFAAWLSESLYGEMVSRLTRNEKIAGSIPAGGKSITFFLRLVQRLTAWARGFFEGGIKIEYALTVGVRIHTVRISGSPVPNFSQQ